MQRFASLFGFFGNFVIQTVFQAAHEPMPTIVAVPCSICEWRPTTKIEPIDKVATSASADPPPLVGWDPNSCATYRSGPQAVEE